MSDKLTMKYYIVAADEMIIAKNVSVANNFYKRLKGLLCKKDLDSGDGLLIYPCKQVHTFGMKFNIDAVFVSPLSKVVHIEHNMPKGKVSKYIKYASQVLELKGGTAKEKNISVGQTIKFMR